MNSVSFCLDAITTIRFTNDSYGTECVYLNDKMVSKKWSFFGTTHQFTIAEDNELNVYEVKSKAKLDCGVDVLLFKNKELIDTKSFSLFSTYKTKEGSQNMNLIIGFILILYSTFFDGNKFFLFLGLVMLFNVFNYAKVDDTEGSSCSSENDVKKLEQ